MQSDWDNFSESSPGKPLKNREELFLKMSLSGRAASFRLMASDTQKKVAIFHLLRGKQASGVTFACV